MNLPELSRTRENKFLTALGRGLGHTLGRGLARPIGSLGKGKVGVIQEKTKKKKLIWAIDILLKITQMFKESK